jgi:hypothetical protein
MKRSKSSSLLSNLSMPKTLFYVTLASTFMSGVSVGIFLRSFTLHLAREQAYQESQKTTAIVSNQPIGSTTEPTLGR